MKKLFLSLFLIFLGFVAVSQTGSPLKMVNFHKLPNEIADLKVLKDECGRDCDLDNNKAALIRVKAQGFSEKTMLEFNLVARPGISIIHKKYKDGEMWLYVSSNCQGTIIIKYMGEYEFKLPSKLEAKGVYELVLGMETATLVINAVPQTAEIYVDGNKIGTGYGSAAISVGSEHRYKVICDNYIPEEDVVRTDKTEKIEKQIELRPNFGYITIESVPSGADVYVDKNKVGTTPYLAERISVGEHRVELNKIGYLPFVEIVTIKAGEHNKQFKNVALVAGSNKLSNNKEETPKKETPKKETVKHSENVKSPKTISNKKTSINLNLALTTQSVKVDSKKYSIAAEENKSTKGVYLGISFERRKWFEFCDLGIAYYSDSNIQNVYDSLDYYFNSTVRMLNIYLSPIKLKCDLFRTDYFRVFVATGPALDWCVYYTKSHNDYSNSNLPWKSLYVYWDIKGGVQYKSLKLSLGTSIGLNNVSDNSIYNVKSIKISRPFYIMLSYVLW